MKKIGTITTAVSLIFFGIVLLIKQMNGALAYEIFKYWPMVFIILGIEVLWFYGKREGDKKIGFNIGIVFIVLLFILTEGFFYVKDRSYKYFKNYSMDFDLSDLGDLGNAADKKPLNIDFSTKMNGNNITFKANNGNIHIKKSEDNNVKFAGKVYVNRGIDIYEITREESKDGIKILADDDIVKKVEGTLYVPDGVNIYVDSNNLNLTSEDDLKKSNIKVDSNNGNFKLSNFKSLSLDSNNGNVNIKDIKDIKVDSNNAKVSIDGDTDNVDVNTNISSIDISSNKCKNIKIVSDSGKVNIKTAQSNLDIDAATDAGVIYLNDKKINNRSIKNAKENAEGKIYVRTDMGTIRIDCKE